MKVFEGFRKLNLKKRSLLKDLVIITFGFKTILMKFNKRKRLLTGTIPVNKKHLKGTVKYL